MADPDRTHPSEFRIWLSPRLLGKLALALLAWARLVWSYGLSRALGYEVEVDRELLDPRTPFRRLLEEHRRQRVGR